MSRLTRILLVVLVLAAGLNVIAREALERKWNWWPVERAKIVTPNPPSLHELCPADPLQAPVFIVAK